jgi:long-chain acyl-CoA synthetase
MRDYGFPSIGCPISCNEMAIHDEKGKALPPGKRGEIVARGPCVMKHYSKRPEANADTFKYGWFRSGDEGFWMEGSDGLPYYFITGRLKELIIRGGVNYSPLEIDEAINAIPGVKAGMAVGFENDMYGEEIGAYVVLEEGADLTEAAVLTALAELPWNKRPKVVVFGTDFPVTSTGKYQRNKLKPLFEQWSHVQFQKE